MEASGDHLAIVIGASPTAEALRQILVAHGAPHTGVAGHLRGLRRGLFLGRPEMTAVCVALDRTTIDRYGEALRTLVADFKGFPSPIHSIGLVPPSTMMSRVVHMGCDVYVGSVGEATDVIQMLRMRQPDRVAIRRAELLDLWAEESSAPNAGGRSASASPRISGWRLWRPDRSADFAFSFRPAGIRRPAAGIGWHEASD
jgi:hypothetical protein